MWNHLFMYYLIPCSLVILLAIVLRKILRNVLNERERIEKERIVRWRSMLKEIEETVNKGLIREEKKEDGN